MDAGTSRSVRLHRGRDRAPRRVTTTTRRPGWPYVRDDGWFYTGDVGVVHSIRDRSKDVIISGGEN
jgi:acyl-CoA synthetase (AMP-forming)/AMP-acid ligase II